MIKVTLTLFTNILSDGSETFDVRISINGRITELNFDNEIQAHDFCGSFKDKCDDSCAIRTDTRHY